MKITYDPEAKALYIYLDEGASVQCTHELSDDVTLDWDMGHHTLIGIEVLNVEPEDIPVVPSVTIHTTNTE